MVGSKWKNFFRPFPSPFNSGGKRWGNRTYIVPTPTGLIFGVMLIFLLVVAYFFGNNLIYLNVFFLTSFGILMMWWTNRLVDRLEVHIAASEAHFADVSGWLEIAARNETNLKMGPITIASHGRECVIEDLHEKASGLARLEMPLLPRGVYEDFWIRIACQAPAGLFRAWKWKNLSAPHVVWPARDGSSEFAFESAKGDGERLRTDDSFQGHDRWTPSYSFRRIDWKIKARTGELMRAIFAEPDDQALIFSWEDTAHLLSFEKRLRQLALWIYRASSENRQFRVQTPEGEFDEANFQRLLDRMASLQEVEWLRLQTEATRVQL